MKRRCAYWVIVGMTLAASMQFNRQAGAAEDATRYMSAEAAEFFERTVRPALAEHCYECHSGADDDLQSELRLDTLAGLARGGAAGPAVVPGNVDESLLVSAVRYEAFEMPPAGQLPTPIADNLAKWVAMLDDGFAAAAEQLPVGESAPVQSGPHWSFVRPQAVDPPPAPAGESVGEIDRFVRAALRNANLAPAAAATPRDLLRRLHYDLTGLPPTAAETAAFEADPSDSAYEREVDRLLAAPQFGERWARFWLDLARYADTRGYVFQESRDYPNAWKYRDWVVGAFSGDMPYDKFIVAQLAGDQLEDPAVAPASGFLTLGRRFLNNPHDIIDDRIDVVTRGLLGLTVACARCHDHKYDAIPTADYYSLYGVFASSAETAREDLPPALVDKPEPVTPVVFLRGNPGMPGPSVPRGFLTCLSTDGPRPFEHGSGRLELAQAIASPDNPLTARVWVNRVWAHLAGRGLAATPSDFGVRGEPPTHPELLDWLACRFIADGWSTKALIRRIVLSRTYRQSSAPADNGSAALAENVDPENRLLWHARRKRLDLEAFRDSVLAAAGSLDLTVGGPPVSIVDDDAPPRRSLYGFIERQNLPAFFRTFDFANPNTHTAARAETLSPHQALYMLNSPLAMQAACQLAARSEAALRDGQADDPSGAGAISARAGDASFNETQARVAAMFQFALGRAATDAEIAKAAEFIAEGRDPLEDSPPTRNPWNYGWGAFDPQSQHVDFHALPHWTGDAWQGGPALPDPALGWVTWRAGGGHPGTPDHAAVLRYAAPAGGPCRIAGRLAHPAEQGDGVRLRLVSSRGSVLGEWAVHHGETLISVPDATLSAGDELYFLVDCQGGDAYDSFELSVEITATDPSAAPRVDRFADGFHGPLPPPLDRWQQLAQVLLMSNEFMYVD
ncbi:MAG: PSD1 domain-containing protein [Planctomycetales bacterium]|nr:PSD1 domain-containing protein [Planctomycetales bacterium]